MLLPAFAHLQTFTLEMAVFCQYLHISVTAYFFLSLNMSRRVIYHIIVYVLLIFGVISIENNVHKNTSQTETQEHA